MRDPYQRLVSAATEFSTPALDYDRQSTPLANLLIANMAPSIESSDRNEVGRRALVQLLALRAWQVRPGGQLPDRLDLLVPEELPGLPNDPYSGRPFGYVRSAGESLLSLRYSLSAWLSPAAGRVGRSNLFRQAELSWKPTPEHWLLYSVGPDFHDDYGRGGDRLGIDQQLRGLGGTTVASDRTNRYDLVFPIPPGEGDSAKRNEPQGRGAAIDRPSGMSRP